MAENGFDPTSEVTPDSTRKKSKDRQKQTKMKKKKKDKKHKKNKDQDATMQMESDVKFVNPLSGTFEDEISDQQDESSGQLSVVPGTFDSADQTILPPSTAQRVGPTKLSKAKTQKARYVVQGQVGVFQTHDWSSESAGSLEDGLDFYSKKRAYSNSFNALLLTWMSYLRYCSQLCTPLGWSRRHQMHKVLQNSYTHHW